MTVDKHDLEFSLSQIHRLIKKYNTGEEKRISSDAAEELASVLTIVASLIVRQAADLSQHAGRKTITRCCCAAALFIASKKNTITRLSKQIIPLRISI